MSNEERYEAIAAYVEMRIANARSRSEKITVKDIQDSFGAEIGSIEQIKTCMDLIANDYDYVLRKDIVGNIKIR